MLINGPTEALLGSLRRAALSGPGREFTAVIRDAGSSFYHPFIYGRSTLNTSRVINGEFNHKNVVAILSQAFLKVNIKQKNVWDMITGNILWFYS